MSLITVSDIIINIKVMVFIEKGDIMMKCKLGWICAGIGAISAMVASSIYFYKRDHKRREAEKDTENKTLFLESTPNKAKDELMKAELADEDQVKSQETEFPKVSLNDGPHKLFEDE